MPTFTPAAPAAGDLAVTVGAVTSGVMLVHVRLDLGRGQRTVVDADLVDQPVEPLAPDRVAADPEHAEFEVRIVPDAASEPTWAPLTYSRSFEPS